MHNHQNHKAAAILELTSRSVFAPKATKQWRYLSWHSTVSASTKWSKPTLRSYETMSNRVNAHPWTQKMLLSLRAHHTGTVRLTPQTHKTLLSSQGTSDRQTPKTCHTKLTLTPQSHQTLLNPQGTSDRQSHEIMSHRVNAHLPKTLLDHYETSNKHSQLMPRQSSHCKLTWDCPNSQGKTSKAKTHRVNTHITIYKTLLYHYRVVWQTKNDTELTLKPQTQTTALYHHETSNWFFVHNIRPSKEVKSTRPDETSKTMQMDQLNITTQQWWRWWLNMSWHYLTILSNMLPNLSASEITLTTSLHADIHRKLPESWRTPCYKWIISESVQPYLLQTLLDGLASAET